MSELEKDPERLSEGEGDLAAALREARETRPTRADVGRVAAGLGVILGGGGGGGGTAAAQSAGVTGKLAMAAVVIIGLGGVAWRWGATEAPSAEQTREHPVEPEAAAMPPASPMFAAAPVAHPDVTHEEPTEPSPAVEQTPDEPRRARRSSSTRAGNAARTTRTERSPPVAERPAAEAPHEEAAAPSGETQDAPPSELELLDGARASLRSAPGRALSLTERHRSSFPNGSYVQEREVLAISALARLGRASEARRRADGFRSRWPSSIHLARISAIVAE